MRVPSLILLCCAILPGAALPGRYFQIMDAGIRGYRADQQSRSHYVPGALLVASVLYARQHPDNPRAGDPAMLDLASRLGDILASESEAGVYTKRGDHHRDTYMWLESWRILEPKLEPARRERWKRELLKLIADLARESADRRDRPAYTSPFGVSVNHTALFSSTVYLAGRMFGNREWEQLGAYILHRYAAEEQSPDGYWGEHSRNGPTTAYDFLTVTGVALYWEHSKDPAALAALEKSTAFHKNYTYPDGTSVMITDDRRRHAYVSPWGHFGFSNFPDGRRYAEFLTGFSKPEDGFEHLGRLAQDALYYHEGPTAPIPQDADRYTHRMSVPIAIRKTGPWVVTLSGVVATQNAASRFYLDRQTAIEVFHRDYGVIISGANSKRQPELASFREKVRGQVYHMPLDTRLRQDELALAYNTFIADVKADIPEGKELPLHFAVRGKGGMQEAYLTLQLVLRPGEAIETGSGRRIVPGTDTIALDAKDLGGSIHHRGWTLSWSGEARLAWPIYPYNPYADAPETSLEYAVGTLTFPLERSTSIDLKLNTERD